MPNLFYPPHAYIPSAAGLPQAGAKAYFYVTATSTLKNTYSDFALTTPNANPVVADANGVWGPIYMSTDVNYRVTVKTSADVLIYTQDDVPGPLMTAGEVGALIFPRTAAEISASVTPTTYVYPPLNPFRYGADGSGGAADISARSIIRSVANQVTVITSWKNGEHAMLSDVRLYGVIGDGTTDDSTAFQAALDANKGKLVYVPYGLTPLIAGITAIGSTYDNTIIRVDGELKLKANGGATNYQGTWVGLALESCTNFQFYGNWNGNRAAMTADEHIYCIGIAGTTNTRIPVAHFREIRGDGIYVSQVSWTSNTANPTNLMLGQITGVNSADDGRNLVSLISCDGFTLENLYSSGIGGTVNAVQEPGGFDIEPNLGYQLVRRGVIGNIQVITAGSSGCGITGKSIGGADANDWNVTDISFGTISVIYTQSSGSTAGVSWSRHLRVTVGSAYYNGNAYKLGVQIDYCQYMKGNFYIANCRQNTGQAVILGFTGTVSDFDLYFDVQNCPSQAIMAIGVTRGKVRGRVGGTWTAASSFGLYIRPLARTITQTAVVYSVDIPYDGLWARAVAYETSDAGTMTFAAGTVLRDCDFTGFSVTNTFLSNATNLIPSINCTGRNIRNGLTAAPAVSFWAQFDRVEFDQTAGSTSPGAICITGGSPGTWKARGNVAA